MLIASDKDLATLRAGIYAEVEDAIHEENYKRDLERIQARVYVDNPVIRPAEMLMVGDVFVNCDGGSRFYEDLTVCYVGPTTPDGKAVAGDLWVEYGEPGQRGSGGHAFKRYDTVLVKG